ncbi:MAG: tRNA 5-methoxyuridine(34)/uridine 5-oxyacetic acid(34) synthase CmoB [Gammaproteobacteria bacterium]|nr:tRNA 5-methoxyuridine(34)/uridine 5-oxyacetic acid(34) synthase CmoB [Gammaproteobacteria bacterium]
MIDYTGLYSALAMLGFSAPAEKLKECVDKVLSEVNHGDHDKWMNILNNLPLIAPSKIDLQSAVQIGLSHDCDKRSLNTIEALLHQLHPWRKGPFELFGIQVDTEWRSDFKWQRLKNHISPLVDRMVLDIGCGSGYHCWRMVGAGARLVMGIDPTLLYVIQFYALQKYCQGFNAYVLPLSSDAMPADFKIFDTVFSMGVLYHRRSPIDHLMDLKQFLRRGGELVLETLVIDGAMGQTLVPEGRYAKMRNVWFIPTPQTLVSWLRRCGYSNIQLIDITQTTLQEQRATNWMQFESLKDFLDPADETKTIEGLPAPQRAIIVANAS